MKFAFILLATLAASSSFAANTDIKCKGQGYDVMLFNVGTETETVNFAINGEYSEADTLINQRYVSSTLVALDLAVDNGMNNALKFQLEATKVTVGRNAGKFVGKLRVTNSVRNLPAVQTVVCNTQASAE